MTRLMTVESVGRILDLYDLLEHDLPLRGLCRGRQRAYL
jgi:hypothetical protein